MKQNKGIQDLHMYVLLFSKRKKNLFHMILPPDLIIRFNHLTRITFINRGGAIMKDNWECSRYLFSSPLHSTVRLIRNKN